FKELSTERRVDRVMAAPGQKRTHAPQQTASLFDHLVGAQQERLWNFETERLGGFEVDDEPVCRRLLKWQIARFLAAQNTVSALPLKADMCGATMSAYPRKRTFMSALGQKRTCAMQ